MTNIVFTILFISLAAFCKAVADTLDHHFDTSVFRKMTKKYWDPDISYRYVKYIPLTKYRPDAWHLANSAMIIFLMAAVVNHQQAIWWLWELIIAGVLWNGVFNLFYNKILR